MRRPEIDRKFDEIVDFSGVGRFLDTPVKRYSSGMQVRLGFAVAAHLEPEILFVDEVLAVGDAAFQGKCLGKMDDVSDRGERSSSSATTWGLITTLCPASIWLDEGSSGRPDQPPKSSRSMSEAWDAMLVLARIAIEHDRRREVQISRVRFLSTLGVLRPIGRMF